MFRYCLSFLFLISLDSNPIQFEDMSLLSSCTPKDEPVFNGFQALLLLLFRNFSALYPSLTVSAKGCCVFVKEYLLSSLAILCRSNLLINQSLEGFFFVDPCHLLLSLLQLILCVVFEAVVESHRSSRQVSSQLSEACLRIQLPYTLHEHLASGFHLFPQINNLIN